MRKNIFVGRKNELTQLNDLYKEAKKGLGKVIFISGEPGSGKSSLMNKFLSEVSSENTIIACSECVDKEGINAYLPFKEILIEINAGVLKNENNTNKKDTIEKLKSFVNDAGTQWIGLIPVVGNFAAAGIETFKKYKEHFGKKAPEDVQGEIDIQQLFEKEFRKHAQNKTLIIFLDDLQWADNASLNLLFSLARSIRKNPFKILLVGTYRPNDIKIGKNKISDSGENIIIRHPFADKLNEIRNYTKENIEVARTDKWFIEIEVNALTNSDIKELVEKKFPKNTFTHEFFSKLEEVTQGHALFVNEILQNLLQQNIIYINETNFYEVKNIDLEKLPTSINGIIAERVERLDKELRKIISYASIDGEQVTVQILEKLLKIDELDLLDNIEELSKQHGLLEESEPLRISNKLLDLYYFTHTLVHKYVYENLDASRRRALHRRLAEVLKEMYGDEIQKFSDIKARYDLHNQIGQGLIDGITLKISNFHNLETNEADEKKSKESIFEAIENEINAADNCYQQFAVEECINHLDKALAFLLQLEKSDKTNILKFNALKLKTEALHWKGIYNQAYENSEKLITVAEELYSLDEIAKANSLKAKCLEALGDYEKAIEFYEKALKLNENRNKYEYAENLNNIGYVKVRYGKYEEAISNFQISLKIFEELKNEEKQADSIKNIGYAYRIKGDFDKGIKYYGKALLIFERLNSKRNIANCYNSIGLCLNWKGDYAKSITFFEKSIQIDNEINDIVNKANHLNNIGLAKENMGDFDGAIEFYLKTLEIDESLNDKVKIAISYSNIGSCYTRQGKNFSKALDYLEQSLNIYYQLNDNVNIASTYQNIGEIYRLQYDDEKAYEYFSKSLKINQEIGDFRAIVGDYINIANIYSMKGDNEKAIEYYKKTIAHFVELNDKVNLGIIYNNLSSAYRQLYDYETATQYIIKSLEINKATNDKLALKRNYDILASIYIDLNKFEAALDAYESEIEIAKELNNQHDIAISLSKIGSVYFKMDKFEKAIKYFQQSAKMNDNLGNFENYISDIDEIANSYLELGKFEEAIKYYFDNLNYAIKYNLLKDKANAYNNIGFAYHKKDELDKAFDNYSLAIDAYREIDDIEGIRRNYRNISVCFEEVQEYDKAIEYLRYIADNLIDETNKDLLADTILAIGVLYYKAEKDDDAIECYYDAYDLYSVVDDFSGQSNCLYNLGLVYKYNKNFKKALENFKYAKSINKQNGWEYESINEQIEQIEQLIKDVDDKSPKGR